MKNYLKLYKDRERYRKIIQLADDDIILERAKDLLGSVQSEIDTTWATYSPDVLPKDAQAYEDYKIETTRLKKIYYNPDEPFLRRLQALYYLGKLEIKSP